MIKNIFKKRGYIFLHNSISCIGLIPRGGTKHIYIRGGKFNTSGLEYLIFLGPRKAVIMFIIFFLASDIVKLIFLGSLEAILNFILCSSTCF